MMYFVIGLSSLLAGLIICGCLMSNMIIKPTFSELSKTRAMSAKHFDLYMLMNDWVKVKQNGTDFSEYFQRYGYKKVAIYGLNYVGITLLKELSLSSIDVVAGIDMNSNGIESDVKVYSPDDFDEKVDVIVVTPITYFDSICEKMEKKVDCAIVSIEDVVYELLCLNK